MKTGKNRSGMLTACLLGILTGIVLGGCGKAGENRNEPMTEPEENIVEKSTLYMEPPLMGLCNEVDAEQSVFLRACGYTWTYLETEEQAVSAIADSAYVLAENASWETLILPETDSGISSYTVSVISLPDELGFTAWDIADMGKQIGECSPLESQQYSREEIGAGDFSVSLQPGRIYEMYMEWEDDKLAENGFCGIAYYIVKTAGKESEAENADEKELTGKDNGILISIDDSYRLSVCNEETGEEIQSDSTFFASKFSDILIKYSNLDIVEDENQYTDDSVIYCMQIFDPDSQLVQTIEYTRDYLCIDKIRYRDKGLGTSRELFLAIDNLFQEDFPTASFGEEDDGEVDAIEEVTMEAAYVTPKGIHLIFTNHTDEEYIFGADYELQAWQDGKWRKVDYIIDNAAFNAIGYSLPGNSQAGWDVKWTYFHGVLPDGQYRITKTVDKESAHYRIAAEFTVYTGM